MNRRQKIIVSVVGIFIVLLALVGITYGYFLTRIQGNTNTTSLEVTTADLKLDYIEGDSDGDGEPDPLIVAEKIEPDTVIAKKVFSVKNSGNVATSYSVIIDEMENDFDRNQDLVYTLTKSGETDPVATGYLAVGTHQIILPSVDIAKDIIDTYTLKLEYVEAGVDQSIDMNKTLNLRVNISNTSYTWNTAPEGSLLYALRTKQTNSTETTIPGQQASSSAESRILETEDDYGTSYVYRGNVQNNYVTYSNMCWRIVRVQGDGTIKLVLADWEHPCGTANGYNTDNDDSAFIADENGEVNVEIAFNSKATGSDTDVIFENSDIPDILSDWAQSDKINLNMSKLVSTDWCNDTSYGEDVSYGYYCDEDGNCMETNNPEMAEEWYPTYNYSSYKRLSTLSSASPILKCNQKGLNNTKSIRYKGELGILSADEVAFAGSTIFQTGIIWDYYLKTNSTINQQWLMSPVVSSSEYGNNVMGIGVNGQLKSYYSYLGNFTELEYPDGSVRPSVVLRSDVSLKTGLTYTQDGTIDRPYVIK